MIRVLEVLATLKRAGAETMAVSLVNGLDRHIFTPAVVSLFDAFPHGLEAALSDVPIWHLGKRPGFDPRVWMRLRRVIREWKPDIIHTHSYVMRYTLPVTGCAAVHTVHNVAAKEVDRIGRAIHRYAFRRGVATVAVSHEVARSFAEVYGFPPTATILNGIATERFYRPQAREEWRRANGFSPDDVLIVSVARLEPQKNPLALVAAFERLPEGFHLVLVGDGSLRPQLTGRARVQLLGVRDDLPELLSAADVFALASDWEGHPIAVMEAMAAGLPVVATAVGGLPEIVSAQAGRLVPRGDMNALERALLEVSAQRRTMGVQARRQSERFGVQPMIDSYSALFRKLVR
jgi:glycosyltransferase involved in cell wall biosynthesis